MKRTLFSFCCACMIGLPLVACSADVVVKRNIPYASPTDPRNMLDVYAAKEAKKLPVVFWIHGGGWESGDKLRIQEKPTSLVQRGFVFVAVNHRFLPKVDMDTLIRDVAKAVGWVCHNIAEYGGDPQRIFIMGHSSGAQLAAILCTNDSYLKERGVPLISIKGCVPVDGDTYDVPAIIEAAEARRHAAGKLQPKYGHRQKFGDDPAKHRYFSAVTHVAAGKNIPPFLILHVDGQLDTTNQAKRLATALSASSISVKTFAALNSDHLKINASLGVSGDSCTEILNAFLEENLKK